MEKAFDLLALGEIMLRLTAPGSERISRGDMFQKHAGGSELNVASGVSLLGLRTGIISKLPANELGSYIKNSIRFVGVSDDDLLYDEEPGARLGLYYYEYGAAPRKPTVIYDRTGSSFHRLRLEEIPEGIYASCRCFHTSGITLALGEELRETALEMIRRFKAQGALISFDINYRATLWSEEEARNAVESVLPMVDVLFVSEETSRRMLQRTGEMRDIMRGYCAQYGTKIVASTQRNVNSPRSHDFGSLLYSAETGEFYEEKPYRNIDVVDRIGSGDAFVSGVLYGLLATGDPALAQQYGNAASAVKNTVPGDLPSSDLREIQRIIKNHHSDGGSELNR